MCSLNGSYDFCVDSNNQDWRLKRDFKRTSFTSASNGKKKMQETMLYPMQCCCKLKLKQKWSYDKKKNNNNQELKLNKKIKEMLPGQLTEISGSTKMTEMKN